MLVLSFPSLANDKQLSSLKSTETTVIELPDHDYVWLYMTKLSWDSIQTNCLQTYNFVLNPCYGNEDTGRQLWKNAVMLCSPPLLKMLFTTKQTEITPKKNPHHHGSVHHSVSSPSISSLSCASDTHCSKQLINTHYS